MAQLAQDKAKGHKASPELQELRETRLQRMLSTKKKLMQAKDDVSAWQTASSEFEQACTNAVNLEKCTENLMNRLAGGPLAFMEAVAAARASLNALVKRRSHVWDQVADCVANITALSNTVDKVRLAGFVSSDDLDIYSDSFSATKAVNEANVQRDAETLSIG